MSGVKVLFLVVSAALIATRGHQMEGKKGKFRLKVPFGSSRSGVLSQLKRLIPSPKSSVSNANSTLMNLNGTNLNAMIERMGIEESSNQVTSGVDVIKTKNIDPSMVKIGVDSGEVEPYRSFVMQVLTTFSSEKTSSSLFKSSSSTIERKPTNRVKMNSAVNIQHNDHNLPLSSSMQNDDDLSPLGDFIRFEPCHSQPKWFSVLKLFLFYHLYYVYAVAMSLAIDSCSVTTYTNDCHYCFDDTHHNFV